MKFNLSSLNMSAIYATRVFDKLLDKATNSSNLEPDWTSILQVCDSVRQNDIKPKYAIMAVKKKLHTQNPHQVFYSLLILESMMKNCGTIIHDEVATKAFCDTLHERLKETTNDRNKIKMLDLIQAWAIAFRKIPKYRPIQDLVNIIKSEGYLFPSHNDSEAMFSAQAAPKFLSGDICHRCRVPFSLILRRHHCRACGQPFCQQCSPNTTILPQFGIEKEVRVCENCYERYAKPCSSTGAKKPNFSFNYKPKPPLIAPKPSPEVNKRADDLKLQQEEDLQLALALSRSEAEHRERQSKSFYDKPPSRPRLSTPLSSRASAPSPAVNSEMNHYLDRKFWEKRAAAVPTAPLASAPQSSSTDYGNSAPHQPPVDCDDLEDKDIDKFIEILRSQIEIFINRMKSDSSRGRHISNDSSVQGLFLNITAMHSKLLQYIEKVDDKRVYLESLQDKVSQVRDSRAALDLLRSEHTAHLAAVQKAAISVKQSQMAAKLALLRQKKQEYLQYQRQLALQKVQEHEREMQLRQQQAGVTNNHFSLGSSINQMPNNYLNRTSQGNYAWRNTTTDLAQNEQPTVSRSNIVRSYQKEKVSVYSPQVANAHNCAKQNYKETTNLSELHVSQAISQPNVRSTLSQNMQNPDLLAHQMHWIAHQQGLQPIQSVGEDLNLSNNMCQPNCNLLQQENMRGQNCSQNINNNFTTAYDPATGLPNPLVPMDQQNPNYAMDVANHQLNQYNSFQPFDAQQPKASNHGIRLLEPSNSTSYQNQLMQDQHSNTPNYLQIKNLPQVTRECLPELQCVNVPTQIQNQFPSPCKIRSKSDTQTLSICNPNIAQQDLQGNYQTAKQLTDQNVFRQQYCKNVANPHCNNNIQPNVQPNVQPNDITNPESILKRHKNANNLIIQRNLSNHQSSLMQQQNIPNPSITLGNASSQQYQQNNANLVTQGKSYIQQLGPNTQVIQTSIGYTYQPALMNNQNPDHIQVTFTQPGSTPQTQICQQNVLPPSPQDQNKTQSPKLCHQPKSQCEQHTIPRIQQMQTCGMPPILQILNNAQDNDLPDQPDQPNVTCPARQQPGISQKGCSNPKTCQNQNTQSLQVDKNQIPTQNAADKTQTQPAEKPQNQQFLQASTTRLQLQGPIMKMQSQISHQGVVRPHLSPSQVLNQTQQVQHGFQANDLQNINNAGMQSAVLVIQERTVSSDHNNCTNPSNTT